MLMVRSPFLMACRASLLPSVPVMMSLRFWALAAANAPMAISSLKPMMASAFGFACSMFSATGSDLARS